MSRKTRRSFTAEQKAAILRRHHVDKVPISQVCAENDLQPSLFYYWQRQAFENLVAALEPLGSPRSKELEARVEALEMQVARKDGVIAKKDEIIAWVAEEHVKLKKTLGES